MRLLNNIPLPKTGLRLRPVAAEGEDRGEVVGRDELGYDVGRVARVVER